VEDLGSETKRAVIAPYKFCIGFENSIAVDYVTEKFFDPILAGTVPVYLGAPNIDAFAPGEKSFINVSDYSGPRELADHLHHLDQDDEAYGEYFAWREKGLSDDFKRLLSAAARGPFCQLCDIVAERAAVPAGGWRWPWGH
jgi:hypothetical protein